MVLHKAKAYDPQVWAGQVITKVLHLINKKLSLGWKGEMIIVLEKRRPFV